MRGLKSFFIIILLLSTSATADAPPIIDVHNPQIIYVNHHTALYQDASNELAFKDIKTIKDKFSPYNKKIFRNIYSSSSNWYWFTLFNPSNEAIHLLLECQYPHLDFVDVYYRNNAHIKEFHTGNNFPFNHRPTPNQNFAFPIRVTPGYTNCFIKVKSLSPVAFPMYLYTADAFEKKINIENFSMGLLTGFVLFLIIFFTIIFLYTRKMIFFASVIIMANMGFASLHESGFLYRYIFPDNLFANKFLQMVNLMVGLASLLMAIGCFEPPPKREKLLKIYIRTTQLGAAILCGVMFFIDFSYVRPVIYMYFLGNLTITYILLITFYGHEKQYRLAIVGFTLLLLFLYFDGLLLQMISNNYFLPEFNHLIRPLCGISSFFIWGIGIMVIGSQSLRKREMAEDLLIRKIKKSEDVQTEFINDLTHELATPLQAIIFSTEKIKKLKIGEPLKTYVDRIYSATSRISTLINNFLENARSDKYELKLNLRDENLKQIIENIIDELSVIASETNHEIMFESEAPSDDAYHIQIDKIYIEQAIFNIIINSIKYSPKGGKILVVLKKTGNEIMVSIADNGYGIPETLAVAVFEPFYRVGSLNSISSGVGLGLSISKKWIEAHGGWIECQSPLPKKYIPNLPVDNIRKGTLFIIHLPAHPLSP